MSRLSQALDSVVVPRIDSLLEGLLFLIIILVIFICVFVPERLAYRYMLISGIATTLKKFKTK